MTQTPLAPDHEGAIAAAAYRRHRRIGRGRGHARPRILQLLATGGNGGAQESYTGLLLHLDRSRYDVRALSLSRGSAVQRLRRLGVEVDLIDEPHDARAVEELAAWLRRHEVDLLHAHMFRAEVVGTRAAVAAGVPVVMATVHSSRVRSPDDVATLSALGPAVDRLIVPSHAILAKVRHEGRGLTPASVIPNGVDLHRFNLPPGAGSLRSEYSLPPGALVVGTVARLEAEKGHRYLLEAWPAILAAVPAAWLVVVGEGSLAGELAAQARALPGRAGERVIFTGRRDDVSALIAGLEVAVLPSLREAQGISLLEAMARGRPVVASAVGGIPEVVTDERDGLLVPSRDPSRLARALIRLLRSESLRRRLGDAGRATVTERFSIEAQVRRVEAVYDEELQRAGVRRGPPRARQRTPRAGGGQAERSALEMPPG